MSNNNGDGKEEPNLKRYAHSRERKRKHRSLSELLALLAQQKENYGTRVNSHYHHLNAIDKFTLTDGTVVTKLANTPLGEGASSEVHKGTDSSRKEYALKYIKIQEDVASLRQEIDLFNKYYAGDPSKRAYLTNNKDKVWVIIMPLLPGKSLDFVLTEFCQKMSVGAVGTALEESVANTGIPTIMTINKQNQDADAHTDIGDDDDAQTVMGDDADAQTVMGDDDDAQTVMGGDVSVDHSESSIFEIPIAAEYASSNALSKPHNVQEFSPSHTATSKEKYTNEYTSLSTEELSGRLKEQLIIFKRGPAEKMPQNVEAKKIVVTEKAQLSIDPTFTQHMQWLLKVSQQMCVAIADAHEKSIIFRDFKPANFLIDPDTCKVWLLDFGSACVLPENTEFIHDYATLVHGTNNYMPKFNQNINDYIVANQKHLARHDSALRIAALRSVICGDSEQKQDEFNHEFAEELGDLAEAEEYYNTNGDTLFAPFTYDFRTDAFALAVTLEDIFAQLFAVELPLARKYVAQGQDADKAQQLIDAFLNIIADLKNEHYSNKFYPKDAIAKFDKLLDTFKNDYDKTSAAHIQT